MTVVSGQAQFEKVYLWCTLWENAALVHPLGNLYLWCTLWEGVTLVHPFGKMYLWCTLWERCTFGAPFGKVYLWCMLRKDIPLVHFGKTYFWCTLWEVYLWCTFGKVFLWCTLGRCSYDASFRKSYLQCCSQPAHVPTSPSDGLTSGSLTHLTQFHSIAQCGLYSLLLLLTSVHQCCPKPPGQSVPRPFCMAVHSFVQREWTPL